MRIHVNAAVLVCAGVLGAGVFLAAQGGGRGGVQIKPGEACPPGTTEVRPGRCSAPEFPPPSIVDYRPRTTLVVPVHPVPKAKFPVIDSHNHTTVNASNIDQLVREMDQLNLRVLVNLSGGSNPDAVKQKVDFIRASAHPDRFRVFANVAWNGAGGPGWAEKAVADLEQSIRNGAVGLKIAKDLGMFARKHGYRLDSDQEFLGLAKWVKANLGPDVPVHFTRFHPEYLLKNLPPTPVKTLDRAKAIADAEGLRYIYVGNLPGHPGENTYCPKCRRAVVERAGFTVRSLRLRAGKCEYCQEKIPGVWGA